MERKPTTPSPVIRVQRPRFKCVSLALAGIDANALSVILVCATSKWVSCGSRANKPSKAELGSVKHSCKPNRLIPRLMVGIANRSEMVVERASENGAEEAPQKSTARSRWRSKNILWRTAASMSSSMCS